MQDRETATPASPSRQARRSPASIARAAAPDPPSLFGRFVVNVASFSLEPPVTRGRLFAQNHAAPQPLPHRQPVGISVRSGDPARSMAALPDRDKGRHDDRGPGGLLPGRHRPGCNGAGGDDILGPGAARHHRRCACRSGVAVAGAARLRATPLIQLDCLSNDGRRSARADPARLAETAPRRRHPHDPVSGFDVVGIEDGHCFTARTPDGTM